MFLNLESYGLQEVSKPLFHYVMNSGSANSDRADYVISMNSFSYLIVPGVRTGWIYTSSSNVHMLKNFNLFSLGVANINEGMISKMIDTGRLEMAVKRIKRTMMKRRDTY